MIIGLVIIAYATILFVGTGLLVIILCPILSISAINRDSKLTYEEEKRKKAKVWKYTLCIGLPALIIVLGIGVAVAMWLYKIVTWF